MVVLVGRGGVWLDLAWCRGGEERAAWVVSQIVVRVLLEGAGLFCEGAGGLGHNNKSDEPRTMDEGGSSADAPADREMRLRREGLRRMAVDNSNGESNSLGSSKSSR